MKKQYVHPALLVLLASLLLLNEPMPISALPSNISQGPYVDEIVFQVMYSQDQRILALQAGDIEIDSLCVDPIHYTVLDTDPDIELCEIVRNGYVHLTFNCEKYPLNYSGLRRAFAFAFDQQSVIDDVLYGFGICHDSLVPQVNSWCIDDDFGYNYSLPQPDIGNAILDELGFLINTSSGYRMAPNGSSFSIDVLYSASGTHPVLYYIETAFEELHIDANMVASDWNIFREQIANHEDFDMVYWASNFEGNDIRSLMDDFTSMNAEVNGKNPSNFRNTTFDSYLDQFINSSTYEEVFEAAAEMQHILHYNVPQFVVYENVYINPYRVDRFTGHIQDTLRGICNPWTLRNIKRVDGYLGGTVTIAISDQPDSFNIYTTNSRETPIILDNLLPSLYKVGPDQSLIPDICENMLVETHDDNPEIPDGTVFYYMDLVDNATWSNGESLYGSDVSSTFVYSLQSGAFGNPAWLDFKDIDTISGSMYDALLIFNTESYWHLYDFAFDYILPDSVVGVGGIGYSNWSTWNPIFNESHPFASCGPFEFNEYDSDSYVISKYPEYHYPVNESEFPREPEPTTATTTTTTSVTTTTTTTSTGTILPTGIPPNTILTVSVSVGSSIVIIIVMVRIYRYRKNPA